PVERGEIVKSDIILPSADLPVDEAKKLFRGEGVIPAA
ncbi:MAG: PspA-associated protein PspAA, partial [Nitrososphaera sp.]